MTVKQWVAVSTFAAVGTAHADSPPPELKVFDVSSSRLSGLHIAPKVFTEDDRQAIGITYDWEQEFEICEGERWLTIAARAEGNVAFHAHVNPHDFLSTRVGVQASRGWGGVAPAATSADALIEFAALRSRAAELETAREFADFLRSEEAATYLSFLTPQLDVHLHLDGGLESDQRFVEKQWVLGVGASAELNLWGACAHYNLFDIPFAIVRYLASRDPWSVHGSTVPVVTIGYDLVSPVGGAVAELHEDESFGRVRAEVSFQTDLAPLSEDESLRIGATWRGFRELSPSNEVETLGFHQHSHIEVRMSTTKGQYVSYGEGRLPFDTAATDAYAIGWEVDW